MRSRRNVCQNIHAHIIQQVSINPYLITNPEVSASDTTVSDYGQSSGSTGGLNLQIPSPQSPLLESGIPLEPVATLRLRSQGRHQLRRGEAFTAAKVIGLSYLPWTCSTPVAPRTALCRNQDTSLTRFSQKVRPVIYPPLIAMSGSPKFGAKVPQNGPSCSLVVARMERILPHRDSRKWRKISQEEKTCIPMALEQN